MSQTETLDPNDAGWVCEAAAQGCYTPELLVSVYEPGRQSAQEPSWLRAMEPDAAQEGLRRTRWDLGWEQATLALQRGLEEGLVAHDAHGQVVLTEQGQQLLDAHRKTRRPMKTFAFTEAAKKLRRKQAALDAEQREVGAVVQGMNATLDRLLGL